MHRAVWLLAFAFFAPSALLSAAEPDPAQTAQLKKLAGRWTATREETTSQDMVHRRRVEFDFTPGGLKIAIFDENNKPNFDGDLRVLGVEEVEGVGLGTIWRIKLGGNDQQHADIYYDFVGEKLILVGRVGWRPWEGFSLAGEYSRPERPKPKE